MDYSIEIKNKFKDIVREICHKLVDHINTTLQNTENEIEYKSFFKPLYTYLVVKGQGGSFPTVKTIDIGYSYELIEPIISSLQEDEKTFLNENNFFESKELFNLHFTKLGKFVINYIEDLYQFEIEYPYKKDFDEALFHILFENTWHTFFSKKVEIHLLYPVLAQFHQNVLI